MNSLQESDQVTYSFLFVITPLDIVSTESIKNLKKSLLMKLGNRTEKTSELNKPIEIPVDVLYSKTLKKYCPIKGILKVYDINLDGSEVISSVGGFQAEEILNQQKNNVVIEKDIGTSKIKMRIEIKNLGVLKGKPHFVQKQQFAVKKEQSKYPLSRSRTRQNAPEMEAVTLQKSRLLQNSTQKQQSLAQDESKKQKTLAQFVRRSTPMIPEISSIQSGKKAVEVKKKLPDSPQSSLIETVKQKINKKQEVSEVQSSKILQQNPLISQILRQSQKDKETLISQFEKVINGLETRNGKIWIQNNQKQQKLTLKYKEKGFDKIFNPFLEFMIFQLSKPRNKINLIEEIIVPLTKDFALQAKIKLLTEQLSRKTNQIFTLRQKQRQKTFIESKQKAISPSLSPEMQSRMKQLQNIKKTLQEQNEYLKQKDETMQQIISEKQNEIEILKQEITQIQLEFKELQSTIKNDACEIQELKEEVSNLNEVIDSYREKYGDLKNVKNRALENQLKECLIWIDQQTRELEMSDFAEDTEPSHSHNVSEIIKSIQLEGASREEMNSIKIQLAGLIRRIDNFLAK